MKYLLITLLAILTCSCQNMKNMNEQQKEIIQNYINSYNAFDINGMTKDLDEKVVFENISNEKVDLRTEGINDFRKQAESAQHFFEERKQTITSWNFNDNKVSINIDYKAILAIDLPNGLKKGDTLKLKGQSEFEFNKGKIIRITDKS